MRTRTVTCFAGARSRPAKSFVIAPFAARYAPPRDIACTLYGLGRCSPRYNGRMKALLLIGFLVACGSKEEKSKSNDLEDMKDEASVDWAREQLAALDTQLASKDPGQASSTCAVIKPDMAKIQKADKKLADTLAKKCGPDLALRSLAVFVERAEEERAKDPDAKFLGECSGWNIYMKPVTASGAEGDPQVATLKERFSKACPGKP